MQLYKKNNDETAQFEDQIDIVKSFFIEFTDKVLSVDSMNGKGMASDFNLPQIKTLSAFREDRGYTMGELSKNMRVAYPRMTLLIDALEDAGIVRRVRDNQDRRVVKVRLTTKGKSLLRKFGQKRRQETAALLNKLSKSDRIELLDSFNRIIRVLKKLNER